MCLYAYNKNLENFINTLWRIIFYTIKILVMNYSLSLSSFFSPGKLVSFLRKLGEHELSPGMACHAPVIISGKMIGKRKPIIFLDVYDI